MTDSKRHSEPRADVLAEDYEGTYLWEQFDKARTRIAEIEEQLETLRIRLDQISRSGTHVEACRIAREALRDA